MNIKIHQEKQDLKIKAGKALNVLVKDRHNKPLLMLLSGGSSLDLLQFIESTSISPLVTFGMLDDRYSKDPNVNSFDIVERSEFYRKVYNQGAHFISSKLMGEESLDAYGERYENEIKKWIKQNPEGIMRATIGIGPDGHTSGILPFPENPSFFNEILCKPDKFIVGYDVGEKNQYRYRMTSTFLLMKKFDKSITFMTGENKRQALEKVFASTGSLAETPGRIIRELKEIDLYTDINTPRLAI